MQIKCGQIRHLMWSAWLPKTKYEPFVFHKHVHALSAVCVAFNQPSLSNDTSHRLWHALNDWDHAKNFNYKTFHGQMWLLSGGFSARLANARKIRLSATLVGMLIWQYSKSYIHYTHIYIQTWPIQKLRRKKIFNLENNE